MMTLLRYILIMYVLFNYISPSLTIAKNLNQPIDYDKTRAELKRALQDLQTTSTDSAELKELDRMIKLIDSQDRRVIRTGNPYLQYIKNLATKRREAKNDRNSILNRRRFLDWFKNLFVPNTTPRPIPETTTASNKIKLGRLADEQNLTNVLNRLIDVLNLLNDNIAKQNRANETLGFFVVKVPTEHMKLPFTTENVKNETNESIAISRSKREVKNNEVKVKNNNETENKIQAHVSAANKTFPNIKNNDSQTVEIKKKVKEIKYAQPLIDKIPVVVENVKNRRRKREINVNKTGTAINETPSIRNRTENPNNETNVLESIVTNVTNNLESRMNGRRSFTPQNNIRGKLFAHLFDIFDEIKNKMAPVLAVKNEYNNSVAFKIGYITANLDTLGSNLARLKTDMEGNAQSWGDHEILDLFDVLKIHHNVVMKLIDSLRFYLKGQKDYSFNK